MSQQLRMSKTGITNDLERRVYQHKNQMVKGFTKRYNIAQLLYFEASDDVTTAIAREKQIKGMLRNKKIALIRRMNPQWKDLSEDWFDAGTISIASPP